MSSPTENKTISSRSGHTIEFDDAAESQGITIKDTGGDIIHIDTKGKNIEITAPETITFNCKNMNINVSENMTTSVGMNATETVGMNKTESVGMLKNLSVGMDFITNVVGKMVEFIKGNKESKVEQDSQTIINGKGSTHSEKNHEFHSQEEIQHNSADKNKNF